MILKNDMKFIIFILMLILFSKSAFAGYYKRQVMVYNRNGIDIHSVGLKYDQKNNKYSGPDELYIDENYFIYFSDTLNNRIKQYNQNQGLMGVLDVPINNDKVLQICGDHLMSEVYILMKSGFLYKMHFYKNLPRQV